MIIDGKQMWWCPQHVHPKGEFNGLYMEHELDDHHIWVTEKKRKKISFVHVRFAVRRWKEDGNGST